MFQNSQQSILTVEEMCERLAIGYNTGYKLLNSGEIKAFRIGTHWRIPESAIDEYILRKTGLNKNG